MSDQSGRQNSLDAGDPGGPRDPGGLGPVPPDRQPGRAPGLSRRTFLKGAIAGGVAVGAASLGYWWEKTGLAAGPTPESFAPAASIPPSSSVFRSRPDLWSPDISVASGLRASSGQVFLTPASAPGPAIVANDGSAVWLHSVPGKRAFNLRMATYKGRPVLTWFEGQLNQGTGVGEYVLMDETYRVVARVRAGNGLQGDLHEFILTPEETAIFTVYARRAATQPLPLAGGTVPAGESPITLPTRTPGATLGPSVQPGELLESIVQEVDIATGKVLFEWHSADYVGPDEAYVGAVDGHSFDYFHVNSVDVDADENLLISARHTCTVYKVDRRTGRLIWRLGGKRSDFRIEPGAQFAWQHDARRQPDGTITLFDDGSSGIGPPTEDHSRGLVLVVDESARIASLKHSFSRVSRILAKSQGSMQILPNGNVFVGWGDQPYFTEFASDGGTVLDAQLPDTSTSYRAYRYSWHGRPADRPVLATEYQGGTAAVFASWNGATDVAAWAVLGGDSPDSMPVLATASRGGFETALTIPGRPRFLAVRALDAGGRVVGQSLSVGG